MELFTVLDAVVLAVSHQAYLDMSCDRLLACLRPGGVLMDVKSVLDPAKISQNVSYWSL